MNMDSISEALLATGYFASIELAALAAQPDHLSATVSLTEKGHCQIAQEGVAAIQACLRPVAAPVEFHFDCASRPWPAAALEKPQALPAIWSHREANGTHRLLLDIDPGLSWFEGHFPEQPILAGVVQLHWAGLLTQHLFGYEAMPVRIARLKFQHLVVPPAVLELTLARISPAAVQFRFASGDRVHSQGRLNFQEPET